MKYRPEIDGLRALAVISVIFFHAEFLIWGNDWFKGGYIGVDIFFVLSGYLITRILLQELSEERKLSIWKFYERRARRILPMLFTVIMACCPLAWFILLPTDLVDYAESTLASLSFLSNFYFYFSTIEYGADSSLLKPLLHTWSLSIEEQFYIVFPILLYFAYSYARRLLLIVFVFLFVSSLLFSQFTHSHNPELNFFLPLSRVWELLTGSILAYLELTRGNFRHNWINQIAPTIGLLMIVLSVLIFSQQTHHPGLITLVPIVGVSLIIAFSSPQDLTGRILSFPLMRGIGLISYSLYLWHFPIFAFARYTNSIPTNVDKFEWLVVTVILSMISYYMVEKTTRNRTLVSIPMLIKTLSISIVGIIGIHASIILEDGYEKRLPQIFAEDFAQKPWEVNKNIAGDLCYGNRDFCQFKVGDENQYIFIIGDSTVESLMPILTPELNRRGYNVVSMNSHTCYFAPNFYSSNNWGEATEILGYPCDVQYQNARKDYLLDYPNAIVIIGGLLDQYMDSSFPGAKGLGFTTESNISFKQNYKNEIELLLDLGTTIIQLYPQPTVAKPHGREMKNFIEKNPNATKSEIIQLQSYPYELFLESSKEAYEFLDEIDHQKYYRVYLDRAFCDNLLKDKCNFSDGNFLYMIDRPHPAKRGAELLSELILEQVDALPPISE